MYRKALQSAFLHDVETVRADLVESIVVEELSELANVAKTFYETALRQAIDALGDENVIDGVVVEEYAHTPAAQRLKSASAMRDALKRAEAPDVDGLYRAFVVVSGIVSEAIAMVEDNAVSDIDLAHFRERMHDRAVDTLRAALVDALDDESPVRSVIAFVAIRAAYEGMCALIDDLCVAIPYQAQECR